MDCERFDKVSLELLFDELDELSAAAGRRHLHHCSRCQRLWNKMRATRELCQVPMEDPPHGMFDDIIHAAEGARRQLPMSEKVSRAVSILADYAMRPQLAMAALLLLMIGSSLVFVRTRPEERDKVRVTELGTPYSEADTPRAPEKEALVFEAESGDVTSGEDVGAEEEPASRTTGSEGTRNGSASSSWAYSSAMAAYQEGRYAEAERLFAEVAAAGGEKAASAALHEGHAARNGSGCQRAAALYDAVAARYSGSTVAHEAVWHAASCFQTLGQIERARAHYALLTEKAAYAERARAALASLPPSNKESESAAVASRAKASAQPEETEADAEQAAASKPAATPSSAAEPRPHPAAKPTPKGADSSTDGEASF